VVSGYNIHHPKVVVNSHSKIILVNYMNFNDMLKNLRVTNSYTQRTVSSSIGISNKYYQELEYGKKEPTMSKLVALADFFNVSIDYLVGRTDNPEVNK